MLTVEYTSLAQPGQATPNLFTDDLRRNIEALREAVVKRLAAQDLSASLIAGLNRDHDAFIRAIAPMIAAEREAMLASSRQAVRDSTAQIGALIDDSFEALRAVLQIEAKTNYIAAILYLASLDDKLDTLALRRSALVEPIASIKSVSSQIDGIAGGRELAAIAAGIYRSAFAPKNIIALRHAIIESGDTPPADIVKALRTKVHWIVAEQARFRQLSEEVLGQVDSDILTATSDADAEGQRMIAQLREELGHLENVMSINADANLLFGLMSLAGTAAHGRQVDKLEAQQRELRTRISRTLGSFEGAHLARELDALLAPTLTYGTGDTSIFDARRAELAARVDVRALWQETEELTTLLTITARVFASDAEAASESAAGRMHGSLARGEKVLLVLALASVVLAALIAWAFVYRHIVRWLKRISGLMHELAAGNLDIAVPSTARNDEIGEMTGALRVFQANAIRRRRAEAALKIAKEEAERALADLQKAQARLIQSEKMASLGQLTAGIAHEIKNPLNFVNNFAKLSDELLHELAEILEEPIKALDGEARDDAEDLLATVRENLGKINEHGKRADSIVKNMLLHSREGPSEQQTVALNPIAEEALNLAYHGARAEHPGFNIEMNKSLDPGVGEIECFPQDIMRVFLNLFSNGMYAANKRASEAGGAPAEITLTTRTNGAHVEIEIRDNGAGIPPELREKIFNPFFTTKPAGEGTGLGLSLSYDIVVKQHGGELTVESEPGEFTVFRVSLPRSLTASGGNRP
jgi:signal transduction histidine kinase